MFKSDLVSSKKLHYEWAERAPQMKATGEPELTQQLMQAWEMLDPGSYINTCY